LFPGLNTTCHALALPQLGGKGAGWVVGGGFDSSCPLSLVAGGVGGGGGGGIEANILDFKWFSLLSALVFWQTV
jgi:hypothetical protein